MTQLDRLEALADIAQDSALSRMEWGEVADALPDLIRVARAAKLLLDCHDYLAEKANANSESCSRYQQAETALAPLFAEVES